MNMINLEENIGLNGSIKIRDGIKMYQTNKMMNHKQAMEQLHQFLNHIYKKYHNNNKLKYNNLYNKYNMFKFLKFNNPNNKDFKIHFQVYLIHLPNNNLLNQFNLNNLNNPNKKQQHKQLKYKLNYHKQNHREK